MAKAESTLRTSVSVADDITTAATTDNFVSNKIKQNACNFNDNKCIDHQSNRNGICDSVLDCIGQTPLVKLNYLTKEIEKEFSGIGGIDKIEVLVKCEYLNAGGSIKDRIGKQMVLDAEKSGRIKKGDTLIEPTSGNTGIGLALCAATRGYRCIIVLPEKMSKEKVDVLKALGAEIVRTPSEAAHDAPDSHISVARRLNKEIPNSHILDQYTNPSNPNAHYYGTAQEIYDQCKGRIDMVVAGAGTGGTITGISKLLKKLTNNQVQVVGADPRGSILAQPDKLNDKNRLEPYQVEGIGYDFIPQVLERKFIDTWYKSDDTNSLVMMRKLIRYEGLLCGGSAGSAVDVALRLAIPEYLRKHKQRIINSGDFNADQKQNPKSLFRCVIILADSVRNYMTKALADDWMISHGFIDNNIIKPKKYSTWWSSQSIFDLRHRVNTPVTITNDVTCKDAIALLKMEGFDMVPVLDNEGNILGVVTEGNMTNRLLSGRCTAESTVADARVIFKQFRCFKMNDTLADLAQALDTDTFALIITEQRCFVGAKTYAKGLLEQQQSNKKRKYNIYDKADDVKSPHSSLNGFSAIPTATPLSKVITRSVVSGIVTRIDLLDYISSGDNRNIVKPQA